MRIMDFNHIEGSSLTHDQTRYILGAFVPLLIVRLTGIAMIVNDNCFI